MHPGRILMPGNYFFSGIITQEVATKRREMKNLFYIHVFVSSHDPKFPDCNPVLYPEMKTPADSAGAIGNMVSRHLFISRSARKQAEDQVNNFPCPYLPHAVLRSKMPVY